MKLISNICMTTKELPHSLFPNDETNRHRDSRGRFCTPEREYADKAIEQNKRLRYDREKYIRAYFSAAKKASMLERELHDLKLKIKQLIKNKSGMCKKCTRHINKKMCKLLE